MGMGTDMGMANDGLTAGHRALGMSQGPAAAKEKEKGEEKKSEAVATVAPVAASPQSPVSPSLGAAVERRHGRTGGDGGKQRVAQHVHLKKAARRREGDRERCDEMG